LSETKQSKIKINRDRLLRILSMCLAVRKRGTDPFDVEVKKTLDTMRRLLPEWELPVDFNLDIHTLGQIANIVELQGKWLRLRSTSLYVDPILIELKLRLLDEDMLTRIFQRSWSPIVTFERMTPRRLKEAIDYWNQLPTIDERTAVDLIDMQEIGSITKEDLLESNIMYEEEFQGSMLNMWEALKASTNNEGRVDYWSFIKADTFDETVKRAYLASFMVTYGYASIEQDHLEEETYLIPFEEQKEDSEFQGKSVTIPIDYEQWRKIRRK